MEVIHLTERNEDALAAEVASLLARGGVAAVPTDTVYGLAADVTRDIAVRKIFRIKARTHTKALPVFIRDVEMARQYAYVDDRVARLLGELWPGQTTVVLDKRAAMSDAVTGGGRTVGLRIPDYPFLRKLLLRAEHPITATSANRSGSESPRSGVEVQQIFSRTIPRPEVIVDGGMLSSSPSSTVLDLTDPESPKILRMGAITKQVLDEILGHWDNAVRP